MTARPRHLTVSIGTFALRGFPPDTRHAIAAAFRNELETLLMQPTAVDEFGGSRSLASLPASRLRAAASTSARDIGARAAAHVVRGVKRA